MATVNKKTEVAKTKMMHINVRRPVGSQEDGIYVGVNGKTWFVRYNTPMMVPEPVYYHLKQSMRAETARDAFIEHLGR